MNQVLRQSPHALSFERLEDRILLSGVDPLGCYLSGEPGGIPFDPTAGEPADPNAEPEGDILTTDVLYLSDASQDYIGWIGDVNGDGFGDYVVGRYVDGASTDAWIVFGDDSGELPDLDVASPGGIHLPGVAASGVMSLGDISGDGLEDLLINRTAESTGDAGGTAYVVFGSADRFNAAFDFAALDGTNGFQLRTDDNAEAPAVGFSPVGDLNGDGLNDLLLTTWAADPAGEIWTSRNYLLFGQAAGFAAAVDLSALNGRNGLEIVAPQDAGLSVAAAGDINHDGRADLLITSTSYGPIDGSATADICVLFGQVDGFSRVIDTAAIDGLTGVRLQLSGYNSVFASGSGDLNGDGIDDLVISASGAVLDPDTWSGADMVVFGRAGGLAAGINLAALTPGQGFRNDWTYDVPRFECGTVNTLGVAGDSPFARVGEPAVASLQVAAAFNFGLTAGASSAEFDWTAIPGSEHWNNEAQDDPLSGHTGRRKPVLIPLG